MERKLSAEQAVASAPVGLVAINGDGVLEMWNGAAETLLGLAANEVLGKPAALVAPFLGLEAAITEGEGSFHKIALREGRRLAIRQELIKDKDGIIIGAVAIIADGDQFVSRDEISELQQMKLLLEAVFEATQDVISVADEYGNLILVNQAYTRVIGLRKEDVIGKPATVDISDDNSMHIQVMKTLEPVWGVPLQVGPQRREVVINAAPVLVQGQLKGSVIVAHDVSEIRRLTDELHMMKSLVRHMQTRYSFDDIIAESPAMRQAVTLAQKAAASSVTVLLSGESGTGKEVFAHAIHNGSRQKNGPFVRVNCTAIPETLLESELFGYEAGAFTGALRRGKKGLFEEASGGTLFLDEIGEFPYHLQAKLLRALQEKEITRVGGTKTIPVQIRIIFATNRDLWQGVLKGNFREDLYYRINVFPILIPPLRQRRIEFPGLVQRLLQKLNLEYGRNVENISDGAMAALLNYEWPGNVRELENILARSMISMAFAESELRSEHLPRLEHRQKSEPTGGETECGELMTLAAAVRQGEYAAITAALRATNNNKMAAARILGISARNLYYKLERYKLTT